MSASSNAECRRLAAELTEARESLRAAVRWARAWKELAKLNGEAFDAAFAEAVDAQRRLASLAEAALEVERDTTDAGHHSTAVVSYASLRGLRRAARPTPGDRDA